MSEGRRVNKTRFTHQKIRLDLLTTIIDGQKGNIVGNDGLFWRKTQFREQAFSHVRTNYMHEKSW